MENNENNEKKLIEVSEEEFLQLQDIRQKEQEVLLKEKELEKRQKEISDRELALESRNTAKNLKKTQKMVDIILPVSELNPSDKFVPVVINGYLWNCRRGVEISVPEEVKNILKEAKYL